MQADERTKQSLDMTQLIDRALPAAQQGDKLALTALRSYRNMLRSGEQDTPHSHPLWRGALLAGGSLCAAILAILFLVWLQRSIIPIGSSAPTSNTDTE